MHLVSTLNNSPYMTFKKINQLKELMSTQVAFLACRQPNEHLKGDWDAARFFVGLVVARKAVAAFLPVEVTKGLSRTAKESGAQNRLGEYEAKLLQTSGV